MPPIPTFSSHPLLLKLMEAVGVTVGADLASEHLQASVERVWFDRGLTNNTIETLLLQTPGVNVVETILGVSHQTVENTEDVIANPEMHFNRLALVSRSAIDREIEASDQDSSMLRDGLNTALENGGALIQQVANAANADKRVAASLRSWLNRAIEKKTGVVEALGKSAEDKAAEAIKGWINGFTNFVASGSFAKARKTGDAKRVSKEPYEYAHLTNPIKTYGTDVVSVGSNGFPSHVQVMFYLFDYYRMAGTEDVEPGLGLGSEISESAEVESWWNGDLILGPDDYEKFSYGVFVDCFWCRKFLAELKKTVQAVNAANVKEVVEIQRLTVPQFTWNILRQLNISKSNITKAAAELVNVIKADRVERKEHYSTTEYFQPVVE